MLLCETAGSSHLDAEDLAVFAAQLSALGLPARVAVGSVPENAGRNLQFDLAPLLADGALGPEDRLVVIAAEKLDDEALLRLRRLTGGRPTEATVFGSFERRQMALGARARLAYALGREPSIANLDAGNGRAVGPAPVFGVPAGAAREPAPPRLLLVSPALDEPMQAGMLAALGLRRSVQIAVLTDNRTKQAWVAANGRDLPVFQHGEALPLALARRTDICVFFAAPGRSYRLRTLLANLLVSGVAVLDGTPGHRLADETDGAIGAPVGLVGLEGFLQSEILPNLGRIRSHARASRAAAAADPAPVLALLGHRPARPPGPRRGAAAPDVVFMPTNGIGLGHAQRCALIARALDPDRTRAAFAVFPSCMRLVKSHGFDTMPLIGRSALHLRSHENDLANYLRLRALGAGARTLVFDGGFVFDSVYRTLLETGIAGIWIRRGLWQATQDNSTALDREKAFERVIVPREAFAELNGSYSRGDHVRSVGPIVQRVSLSAADRAGLRERLAERYGKRFERLAVTALGGGVAADRSLQVQALCGLMERRTDTLHLVVVWPTATIEPGWFAWRNSRVVRSHHAAMLSAAADLAITAAGYNSFHESLYNRVPSIFLPQTGPFMDDQRTRARAAAERGLAATLDAGELMLLERLANRHLDGEADTVRRRLAAADLPEPGTAEAARLIEELTHGPEAMERTRREDRSA